MRPKSFYEHGLAYFGPPVAKGSGTVRGLALGVSGFGSCFWILGFADFFAGFGSNVLFSSLGAGA